MGSRDFGYMDQPPGPYRIVEDMGSAFAMGAIGGGVWYGVKGMRNSPRGDRLNGGFQAIKLRAPILGGNFAAWGGWFSAFDHGFAHLRNTEDAWNSIASGAATGGLLAARAGWRQAGKNAIVGGVLLALIEGLSVMITNFTQSKAPVAPPPPDAPIDPMTGMPVQAVPENGLFVPQPFNPQNAPRGPNMPPVGVYGSPQLHVSGLYGLGPYGSMGQAPPVYAQQPAVYAYEAQQQLFLPSPPMPAEEGAVPPPPPPRSS